MMRNITKFCLLGFLVGSISLASDPKEVSVFTTEGKILTVSRHDQTQAIKTKMIRREVLLSEVITVLTTHRKVSKLQYMIYHHQIGVRGTVTLTDDKVYEWSIEPDNGAVVTTPEGEKIYLLHPDAKTEPSVGGDGKPAQQP